MSHQPFVPEKTDMKEFTLRALLIGLVMTVVLGAANAYLGLRAGMTIAATYPAAVIGMAVLRLMKGSILEENFARTVGSIGESVAAGAIFTIPAFLIAGVWLKFDTFDAYIKTTALLFVGGLLGILFVTFLRRVMVTDPELGFPESVAAAEIHKAGQHGSSSAKHLFRAMGAGSFFYALDMFGIYAASKDFLLKMPGPETETIPPAAWSPSRARAFSRPTSAWAISSARGWPPSTSPAASWPGACSPRCSCSSSAPS